MTHALIEQVLEAAGPNAISLLLADTLYADRPLLAWLKYRKGIDALVSLPEDRLLYQDVQGLADAQLIEWTHHRYVRTVQGHKHIREVEVTAAGDLTSWTLPGGRRRWRAGCHAVGLSDPRRHDS